MTDDINRKTDDSFAIILNLIDANEIDEAVRRIAQIEMVETRFDILYRLSENIASAIAHVRVRARALDPALELAYVRIPELTNALILQDCDRAFAVACYLERDLRRTITRNLNRSRGQIGVLSRALKNEITPTDWVFLGDMAEITLDTLNHVLGPYLLALIDLQSLLMENQGKKMIQTNLLRWLSLIHI